MNILIYYFRMNVKRQCAYTTNLLGEFILSLSYYFIQFVFIDQISSFSGGLGVYNKEEVNLIFTVFILLGLLLSIFTNSIETFFENVAEGRIEVYLTKPVSVWVMVLVGWCKPLNILNFLITLLFAYSFVTLPNLLNPTLSWGYFFISLLCVFLINLFFFMIFNFFTFITSRKMPVDYFHEMIFELSFIPIAIYPTSIVKWMLFIIPVAFSASLPVSLLLNKNEWNIKYLLLSTVIMFTVMLFTYKTTVKKFNGLGG
ncbi:ABC-2 family transporter protein [Brenneria rubrifaciens]|uniref:ABC transporter permease n=1 Tax=Brenneria rubrifaciens TaxID=55213 RepID=A0A4P8QPV9_9GAMM|nr:ABC-2 family transporter protein [Brenneria rubrifaciens]QCR09202.1 ABC transporter permease [Brenneria rubrifaciens]